MIERKITKKNKHGGARANSGRPRKPKPLVSLPLYLSKASAGYGSFVADDLDSYINLNDHFVQHPESSFCLKVKGDSMTGASIYDGDLVIVDKSVSPVHGKVVLAMWSDDSYIKRFTNTSEGWFLNSENPAYPNFFVEDLEGFKIVGVVTCVIHKL